MPTIPAGATAPQDHQTKTEKPKVEKITIELPEFDDDGKPRTDDDGTPVTRTVPGNLVTMKTATGTVDVEVPDEALDDFEVLDDIRAVQDDNDASRLPSLLRRLVGDQYREVLKALRGPNGRVPVEAGTSFVMGLFGALAPNS